MVCAKNAPQECISSLIFTPLFDQCRYNTGHHIFIYFFFLMFFSVLGNYRNEYRFITKANCFFPLKIDTGGPTDILNKNG